MNRLMIAKIFFALCFCVNASAQENAPVFRVPEVARIEQALAHDSMQGRATFSPGIERAADFIASEFAKAGLRFFDTLHSYRQTFSMVRQLSVEVAGTVEGKSLSSGEVVAIGTEDTLRVTRASGFREVELDSNVNLFRAASALIAANTPTIVWVPAKFKSSFSNLSVFARRALVEGSAPVIFWLRGRPANYNVLITRQREVLPLSNVVGVLPGKSPDKGVVLFSAHYDHLGIGEPNAQGDSIYNGANDDASGTTAVIMLAKYFAQQPNRERTIVFVAFTGEELGGFGSRYFSQQLDPEKVVTMFNVEMIGTQSKWGKNSAYITGYDRSDFGKILQKNLTGSSFRFEADPYPDQKLFYRSDNATLAALGVPAHTISTAKMDDEPHYHKQSDEFETLDIENMAKIIEAIALSSRSIIAGEDTPSRVEISAEGK